MFNRFYRDFQSVELLCHALLQTPSAWDRNFDLPGTSKWLK